MKTAEAASPSLSPCSSCGRNRLLDRMVLLGRNPLLSYPSSVRHTLRHDAIQHEPRQGSNRRFLLVTHEESQTNEKQRQSVRRVWTGFLIRSGASLPPLGVTGIHRSALWGMRFGGLCGFRRFSSVHVCRGPGVAREMLPRDPACQPGFPLTLSCLSRIPYLLQQAHGRGGSSPLSDTRSQSLRQGRPQEDDLAAARVTSSASGSVWASQFAVGGS
jgi:hypothetical protein